MKKTSVKPVGVPITKFPSDKKFIDGKIYGSGDMAIVFSNMDTNDEKEWDPIVEDLIVDGFMGITYTYTDQMDDQSVAIEDIVSFICDLGVKKIILIGASRGGVASIKAAARHIFGENIIGVVAFSAPIEHEGTVFYSKNELSGIKIPKLLINSEHDDGADDNRKMLEIFDDPKELVMYPGSAHGTELFDEEKELIMKKLQEFTGSVFGV